MVELIPLKEKLQKVVAEGLVAEDFMRYGGVKIKVLQQMDHGLSCGSWVNKFPYVRMALNATEHTSMANPG